MLEKKRKEEQDPRKRKKRKKGRKRKGKEVSKGTSRDGPKNWIFVQKMWREIRHWRPKKSDSELPTKRKRKKRKKEKEKEHEIKWNSMEENEEQWRKMKKNEQSEKMKKWKNEKNEKHEKMKKREEKWKNEKTVGIEKKKKERKNDERWWKNEKLKKFGFTQNPWRFPGFIVVVVTYFVEILDDFHDFVSECVSFGRKINNPFFWWSPFFTRRVTVFIGRETKTHIILLLSILQLLQLQLQQHQLQLQQRLLQLLRQLLQQLLLQTAPNCSKLLELRPHRDHTPTTLPDHILQPHSPATLSSHTPQRHYNGTTTIIQRHDNCTTTATTTTTTTIPIWRGSVSTGEEPPPHSGSWSMLSPKQAAQPNPSYPALCRQDTTSPWSTDYEGNS